eukprot:6483888-Amphidinium_carterae.2
MLDSRALSCQDPDAMGRLEGKVDRIMQAQQRNDRLTSNIVSHIADIRPVTNKTMSDKSWHSKVCKYYGVGGCIFLQQLYPDEHLWYETYAKGAYHQCVTAEHIYHHSQVSSGAPDIKNVVASLQNLAFRQ